MAITPLPIPPLRSDPTNFAARGDEFLGALPQFQVEANALAVAMNLNSTTDSSTSSITIGTGAKTFVVSSGKSFQPGMYLVIASVSAPSTNSMFGQITSYSGTSLVMSIISVRGSGTFASWIISQSSAGGAQVGPLASSGITGAAASGANTDITSILGLMSPLSLGQGGTGATTTTGAAFALKGANTDITSLNGPSLGTATSTLAAVGDSTSRVATTEFVNPSFSLSSAGNVKLPCGLIIQWMPFTSSAGNVNITWPSVFPTAIYGVVASTLNGTNIVTTVNSRTVSGATIFTHVGSTGAGISNTGFVIAIGI